MRGSESMVRDFLLVQWDDRWVWPNFNIADSLLVFGAGLLLLQAFFADSAAHAMKEDVGAEN
ncbi:MAG: hypothetical protein GXP28_02360 [Planctomycetes bacterium]|nr:hypothetical protein [Planctomycetota bacterium]